jgi:hypothetical protein
VIRQEGDRGPGGPDDDQDRQRSPPPGQRVAAHGHDQRQGDGPQQQSDADHVPEREVAQPDLDEQKGGAPDQGQQEKVDDVATPH